MEDKELVELKKATREVYAICRVLEKRHKSKNEEKIYGDIKVVLEKLIEQITKVDPKFNIKQEYDENQAEVNNMVHKWSKPKTSALGTRAKELLKSIPEISIDNLKNEQKAPETKKQENPISEIEKLEKDLNRIAERMAEYKRAGAYEQEMLAHEEYNEVLSKINNLKSKQNEQKDSKEPKTKKQENPISENDLKNREEQKPEQTALQPTYWQVYNKIATEKCSSASRALYNLSKISVLPWKQEMSTPEKLLSVVGTIYRVPMKLIGYLGTKITRADKKFAKMKEAVENLTPEEFSVLMDTPEESKLKFGREVKSHFDEFSLTSDTMRQYKHNTLALDAIGTRVKAETSIAQSYIKLKRDKFVGIASELEKSIETATPEQKVILTKRLEEVNREIADLDAQSKRVVEKNDAFFNGVEHRTAKYKDTEGWILAKFNPDNRTANQEIQKLQESYIVACRANDPMAVKKAREAIENYGKSQTRVTTVGKNIHNKINRGLYSVDGVKVQNMTPQTIGKQILANLATLACFEKALVDLQNVQAKNEAVQANNAAIEAGNNANQNIPYSQTVTQQVNLGNHIDNVDQATQGMKNINILAGQGIGEHGNLDMSAMETNGSWVGGLNTPTYTARDTALHTASANEVASGSLDSSFQFVQDNIETYKGAMQQYAGTHDFNYSFLNAMDVESIKSVQELFNQLNTPINITLDASGVVTGTQIASMGDIAYKTMSPALIATLVASQAGHIVSQAREKNKKSREERKAQREQEKATKKEQKEAQKEAKKQQRETRREERRAAREENQNNASNNEAQGREEEEVIDM